MPEQPRTTDELFDNYGKRRNTRCFACFKAGTVGEFAMCSCGAETCENEVCQDRCACTPEERIAELDSCIPGMERDAVVIEAKGQADLAEYLNADIRRMKAKREAIILAVAQAA